MSVSGTGGRTGFFAHIGAGGEVFSLDLVDVDVTGEENVGALAGDNTDGIVWNCAVSGGTVKGISGVGMLLGANYGSGSVEDCTTNGTVTGTEYYVGGIVGSNYAVTGPGNTSFAVVRGASMVGGIVGENFAGSGMVIGNQAYGEVSGMSFVGGVVGYNHVNTSDNSVRENTFSPTGTGQTWGIGYDQKASPAGPSNNGATPE
jgi:hypothetical protein